MSLSPNTQAILLLTAPLIVGRGVQSPDLLSPAEYKRLASHLHQIQKQPADLLTAESTEILRLCRPVADESRLQRLLGRGFLLSQVVERWQARAIWVISRADPEYPRRLKARLRSDAPAVLYGCGDISLLETGGLAVVGSRKIDDALVDYTMFIGRLAASANRTLISGGAKGVDLAAMRGALQSGGKVIGVLAENLERTAMSREERNSLRDGNLVLVSAYDPNAGFNVGHAMQRNKLIYALADASLVVNTDLNKGGTWAGAVEQLDKLQYVPVFIRSTGAPSAGLDALGGRGATLWPNPRDAESLNQIFAIKVSISEVPQQPGLSLSSSDEIENAPNPRATTEPRTSLEVSHEPLTPESSRTDRSAVEPKLNVIAEAVMPAPEVELNHADLLFATVRDLIKKLLKTPTKDADIAAALNVTSGQVKVWLQRLVDEGVIEKQKKPVGYVVKHSELFK
ncbi:putative Rossmann fold nucleotide-binding protein DprA/Smf involved in DNA uptake [Pseudomonas sp. SJZ080]|uniref:DNA-processing protein DprA n=1 Tax=Pseudomonas sp. SJZ080 TaxID=2572888 RepID=UPI00119AFDC1|nr:DNA-processing protein DprA [Pseudomonas sp. SJZ080]TWC50924.1 putative Rossmann fold nucleotide-binding protein DprA/Smf involved in DNA uptake [Pseudomonas sp. SJZ080]